jgi:hypothetical protein
MRDLDKYLADHLNEEGNFPGREANWRVLTHRLEAAAARRALVRWQVATGGLLLGLLAMSGLAYRLYCEKQEWVARWAEVTDACEAALSRIGTPLAVAMPEGTQRTPASRFEAFLPERPPTSYEEAASSPINEPQRPEVAPLSEPADADALPAESEAPGHLPFLATRMLQPLEHTPTFPEEWPPTAPRRRESRLWLGLQGTAGIPTPRPGVSLLQGAGLGLEYRAIGQLWLTAAADALSYDVRHADYLPAAFYRETPPQAFKLVLGKPPVPYPLRDVVANQRLRLLSAGLRYRLPVRFWLKPSVQVAHTWTYVSPAIYNYTFVDTLPGTPPKILAFSSAQSTAAYSVRGLWRFGVALERETEWWAIRLGISRQEAFRPDFYDTWLVQGGIWYKW